MTRTPGPKARGSFGQAPSVGRHYVAVPVSVAVAAPSAGSSLATSRLACLGPAVAGSNLTSTVQVAPAATVVPSQLSPVITKSSGLNESLVTSSVPDVSEPLFVTANVFASVGPPPMGWLPKSCDVGAMLRPVGAGGLGGLGGCVRP
jgi:hypothetical protein